MARQRSFQNGGFFVLVLTLIHRRQRQNCFALQTYTLQNLNGKHNLYGNIQVHSCHDVRSSDVYVYGLIISSSSQVKDRLWRSNFVLLLTTWTRAETMIPQYLFLVMVCRIHLFHSTNMFSWFLFPVIKYLTKLSRNQWILNGHYA